MGRNHLAVAVAFVLLTGSAQAQESAVIRPTPNLVADGIPPIPASLAAEAKRYTESRTASVRDWHPVRRELLIATRFGNTAQLHEVRMPGGARRQLTFFDEPVGSGSYEPRSGSYFIFSRDTGGDEFGQLYRYDVADGRITLLSDGGRSQNGGISWSTQGDRIAYGSTRRNGADRDVWIMNPMDPRSDRMLLQVNGGGWSVLDWSADDANLLVSEYVSVNESRIWIVDARTGGKTPLFPATNEKVSYRGARYARDGRGVYLTSDGGTEFQQLRYFDLATRRETPLTTGIDWDVESFALSPDGNTIAFIVNEAGVGRLHLMDLATRKVRAVSGIPTGLVGGLDWHNNSEDLAFVISSARAPADVYSLNIGSNAVTRWTESELGGLVASELSEPQLIRWKSFDDREISGFIYRPPARFTGKRPVIINIHGGPEGQSRPGYQARNNFYINELGVAIIFPNVRGSTGYGKTFVKLDNGMKREESVKDIGALLDWIAAQPDLDASRVMVTGGSYGGYMTLAVATNYNDRISAAVDVVGISDFRSFLENTESYRRDLRRAEYGDERDPAMSAFFERIAPLNNAHKITKPLFVVQGGNDPRVPRTEAEQIVAKVKQNSGHVWYLMAKDEGHGFGKKNNQDFQFYATVMFVRENLLKSKPAL